MRAFLAVPGDLATPTGGYAYARALLAHAGAAGLDLRHLPLPGGFPFPDREALAATARALGAADAPVLVDGLAFGALPPEAIGAARVPLLALVHHPLGLETGIDPAAAARLLASERAALARAAHVVTVSRTTAATLAADLGVDPARITVAPPGLDRAEAAPRRGRPAVILSVGSLTPRKGQDLLLRALGRLAGADWTCRIAGSPDHDPAWAARLREAASAPGLAGRVAFLGALGREALDREYSGADIFCLPSRYEGYGMVFAEAMMRGLPVVALRVPPLPEVVPEAAGLLAPAEDEAALADFLAILLTQPAVAHRMAAAGRAHALGLPGWAETAAVVAGALRAHGGGAGR